jgi:hypothetical protein
MWGLHDNEALL